MVILGNIGAGRPALCGCDVVNDRYAKPTMDASIDCTVFRNTG
jgi:hypothetical protein